MANMMRRNCSLGCCLSGNRAAEKRRVAAEIAEELDGLPPEFEGLYVLFEGRYWSIHGVYEYGYVRCYQWETKQQRDIHMSKLEFQYARRTR